MLTKQIHFFFFFFTKMMMLDVTARNQSFASVQVYGLAYCRQIVL